MKFIQITFFNFLILSTIFFTYSCTNDINDSEEKKNTDAQELPTKEFKRISDDAIIVFGVEDIEASKAFWLNLDFKVINEGVTPNNWAQLTDGSVIISLNEDNKRYMGWLFFKENYADFVDTLSLNIPYQVLENNSGEQVLFISPDSNTVSIINESSGLERKQATLMNYMNYVMVQEFDLKGKDLPNKKLGIFGEVSYPVKNLEESLQFWKQLGFDYEGVINKPYPLSVLFDGIHPVGLHQTDLFTSPGLTYFSDNQEENIENLRRMSFKIIEFMPGKENQNVIIKSPSGYNVILMSITP